MPLDFSKRPERAPQMPSVASLVKANEPIPTGQLFLSDYTKNQLSLVGWKEGDPVPATLAGKLAEIRQAIQQDIATAKPDIDPKRPPTKPNQVFDFAELPPEKRAEIEAFLREAREDAAAGNMAPAVATPQAMLQQAAEDVQFPATIVDDREEVAAKQAAEAPVSETMPQADLPICPRCYYDLNRPFNVEPTEMDKQAFVAAILGRTRFRKQVPIMDQQLTATFRSLTTVESRLVLEQLGYDVELGQIESQAVYMMKMADYRLAASLEQLTDGKGKILARLEPADSIPYTKPENGKETVLVPLVRHIMTEVLPHEPLYQVVGKHLQNFQRVVETLEARTENADFWKGIVPPL